MRQVDLRHSPIGRILLYSLSMFVLFFFFGSCAQALTIDDGGFSTISWTQLAATTGTQNIAGYSHADFGITIPAGADLIVAQVVGNQDQNTEIQIDPGGGAWGMTSVRNYFDASFYVVSPTPNNYNVAVYNNLASTLNCHVEFWSIDYGDDATLKKVSAITGNYGGQVEVGSSTAYAQFLHGGITDYDHTDYYYTNLLTGGTINQIDVTNAAHNQYFTNILFGTPDSTNLLYTSVAETYHGAMELDFSLPTPPATTTLDAFGVFVPDFFTCCYGVCDMSITMPAQLGWWGIGDYVERYLEYNIDGAGDTYTLYFSTSTQQKLQITPTTTPGFHVLNFSLVQSGITVAEGSINIQIISGENCIINDDDYLSYCEFPCYGLATSSDPLNFDNLKCSLFEVICWATKPDQQQIIKLGNAWQNLIYRFPLSPITTMYNALTLAASSTNNSIQNGYLALPTVNQQTHRLSSKSMNLASSSILESTGYIKFRRFQKIAAWTIGAAIPLTIFIIGMII